MSGKSSRDYAALIWELVIRKTAGVSWALSGAPLYTLQFYGPLKCSTECPNKDMFSTWWFNPAYSVNSFILGNSVIGNPGLRLNVFPFLGDLPLVLWICHVTSMRPWKWVTHISFLVSNPFLECSSWEPEQMTPRVGKQEVRCDQMTGTPITWSLVGKEDNMLRDMWAEVVVGTRWQSYWWVFHLLWPGKHFGGEKQMHYSGICNICRKQCIQSCLVFEKLY